MPDFWSDSGYCHAQRRADGRLLLTDDLLRFWWQRPEVAPIAESGDAERSLHAALLTQPRRPVPASELAALGDPDAVENYEVMLAWRDRLLSAPTLEEAYLGIFQGGAVTTAPALIDQLARLIVHATLDGCDDPLQVRAAELFFRPQKVSLQDGAILLADAETVERHQTGGIYGDLGRLLAEARITPRRVELDLLEKDNAAAYWLRSEAHETAIAFNHGRDALAAFCRVLEKWVRHFTGLEVTVQSRASIEDSQWRWHIGLDAEATALLNDLYRGTALSQERARRILALFRMDFADGAALLPDMAGRPVYLGCAMNERQILRIKPQNLLLNLPLAQQD
ncbi:hypothetical protein SAMN06265795_102328 [Noviherbaspirillum humi]|uniref:Uncharacterized protein n=1 Tax=Noviherbaspirillum humi TaxID=1688639 RepID=A0A239DS62_9BURK|nr:DUF6352 family protein [Noviherbaspirillum humi]SNS34961.1 hypothetical protein SAMN06265795_102328 [Noviherbaspirillum humi]